MNAAEALAAYRLQRLLGVDAIGEPARAAALAWLYPRRPRAAAWLGELLDCPWCRAVWAAGAVVALRRLPGGRALRDALALAALAALLAQAIDREAQA